MTRIVPEHSLLDPDVSNRHQYIPANRTNIRERFDRLSPGWNKKPVKPGTSTIVFRRPESGSKKG